MQTPKKAASATKAVGREGERAAGETGQYFIKMSVGGANVDPTGALGRGRGNDSRTPQALSVGFASFIVFRHT